MKQLRFTTTAPYSMLSTAEQKPTHLPDNLGELVQTELKGKTAYIHGEAERLAGFDIPVFLDGDMAQLIAPVKDQDILMVLPSGEYKCKSEYCNVIGSSNCYLITLKKEPLAVPELEEEDRKIREEISNKNKPVKVATPKQEKPELSSAQIIEHMEVMDNCLEKMLKSGDHKYMEQFNITSSILEKVVPFLKYHLHVPKHLEYLLFSINYEGLTKGDTRVGYWLVGYQHRNRKMGYRIGCD